MVGSQSLVLSIDVGSSSVRVSAYEVFGEELSEVAAKTIYRFLVTPDGGAEIDADTLLLHVVETVDLVLDRIGERADDVVGVGMSAFASSVMGVSRSGEPCTAVYTYADTRNAFDAAALRQEWDVPEIYDRTGTPIHASYLPARLRWLSRTRAETVRKVERWITFGEYVFEQLFGRPCGLGLSMAAWSGLMNRHELVWDMGVLSALEVDPESLGEIERDGHSVDDGLAGGWARRWPALARVPWFPPLGDGLCSNQGTAIGGSSDVVINIGTSAAVRGIVPGPVDSIPTGLWEYRFDRDRSLFGGAETNGGNVAFWLRDILGGLDGGEMDDVVAGRDADGHGLTVLPFLSGERSPGWDDSARMTIHGASLNTCSADVLLAGLESVAYRVAAIYDLLIAAVAEPEAVYVSGGALSRSDRWTSILADVLGRPVIRSNVSEPTARGAALWVARALGSAKCGLSDDGRGQVFDPDLRRHAQYCDAKERQRRLYQRMSGAGDLYGH